MRIEEEIKLDYSDVLFRPKEVHYQAEKTLILIEHINSNIAKMNGRAYLMAANMDGVGELE